MLRFITPVILIGIAVAGFFVFTRPLYQDIIVLRAQGASYSEALDNSKALENERDKLTQKYNSFDPESLAKLKTLLPDNVDNIRLILEIEKIAAPYGMVLKNVKYDTTTTADTTTGAKAGVGQNIATNTVVAAQSRKDYGTWDLSFSTEGTYANFLNFTQDLEHNLRIVDIASIDFSSNAGGGNSVGATPVSSDTYTYDFKIKTYWLKN